MSKLYEIDLFVFLSLTNWQYIFEQGGLAFVKLIFFFVAIYYDNFRKLGLFGGKMVQYNNI